MWNQIVLILSGDEEAFEEKGRDLKDSAQYRVAKVSADADQSHYKNNQSFPGRKARQDGWWVEKRSGGRLRATPTTGVSLRLTIMR